MSDNNATVPTQEPTAEEQVRTFTQDEVNAIVGRRVAETSAKYADYDALKKKAQAYDAAEEASKSELQKATERADALQAQLDKMISDDKTRRIRDKVSQETGVPASLLSGMTEDECTAQANAIMEFAKPSKPSYPQVKDSGEVRSFSSGKTRDQFKDWFESNIGH